jgi:Concanavalin A-like lectin/glucanases superfamily/Chaperone of endosialidase
MSQKTAPISSGYLAGYNGQSANAVAIGNNAGQVSQGTGSVAIGYQAGQYSQGVNSMAIGYQAGVTGQGNASFAMGFQAGLISQGNNALAIGYVAGQTGQGPMAEAIGYGAGQFGQGTGAIALGYMAGNTGQGAFAEAIGYQAGASNQGANAFAVGYQAGASSQGANALALGYMAGVTGQSANATAAGYMAGAYGQNANTVAFGYMAGATGQGTGAFAMGFQAGNWNQGQNAIAMGFQAGMTGQGASAIAVGYQAGVTGQNANAVAVGFQAGEFFQGAGAVAVGTNAGMTGQGVNALAVGANAGSLSQGAGAIAFGASAGQFSQGQNAMALGFQAGMTGQKANAVAVGYQAGQSTQGTNAMAVGYGAGQSTQGDNAFAMGYMAGNTGQGFGSVAVGYGAGQLGQGNNAIAVGYAAGTNQGSNAVAIGYQAGMTGQGFGAFAMGFQAGNFGQGVNAMAVGYGAGMTGQKSGALAVGYGAGMITQGTNAMAVGYGAGMYSQGDNGFAVGFQAGVTGQGSNALAMGNGAGASLQGVGAIAVGFQAGMTGQGTNSVAIGYQAGMTGQGANSVAIGYQAGATGQNANAAAIGYQAGQFYQGTGAVAIGNSAGMTGQGINAVAIGNYAGAMRQTNNAFALGSQAGQTNQGSGAMGLGVLAGQNNQGQNAFAAGVQAGITNQGAYAMSIGVEAGKFYQGTGAFAAGWQAGMTGQNANAAAIGFQAGMFTQGTGAFALGYQAGMTGQGLNAVALGYQAGQSTQGNFAVAVGNLAGVTGQNTNAVAIGNMAGQFGQGVGSVAIGYMAGVTGQKANTVAIGNSAGQFNQGANALAVGFQAGMTGQNDNAMALGNSAGQFGQGTGAFAIGFQAGLTSQGANAVAIGYQAGVSLQGTGAFAIGYGAGMTGQNATAVALGYQAGALLQGTGSVAIGSEAGEFSQGANALAVGLQAGQFAQGANALAVGYQAGMTGQNATALAIGFQAGTSSQGTGAFAIGYGAGMTGQRANAGAIGYGAGQFGQGTGAFAAGFQAGQSAQGAGAVAIGYQAGYTGQGANSIAIGNSAGVTGITANSIVLNASGVGFFATGPTGAFYVSPVSTVADSGMIKGNILVYGENNQIMKTPATIDRDGGFYYTNSAGLAGTSTVSSLVVSDGRVQTPLTTFAAGNNAGMTGQNQNSVAIGMNAGQYYQGTGSVAIGYQAGQIGYTGPSSIIPITSGKYVCMSGNGQYQLVASATLMLSTNAGLSFTSISGIVGTPDSIAISIDGQYMLVSTISSPNIIYLSNNYGESWTNINGRMTGLFNTLVNSAILSSPSAVGISGSTMIITSNLTSFQSTNSGQTWSISTQMVTQYFPFDGNKDNNTANGLSLTYGTNAAHWGSTTYYNIGSRSAYFENNEGNVAPTYYMYSSLNWNWNNNLTFTISCRFLVPSSSSSNINGSVLWNIGVLYDKNTYLSIYKNPDATDGLYIGLSSRAGSSVDIGDDKSATITKDKWYYAVVTLNAGLFTLYLDGIMVGSQYSLNLTTPNKNYLTIGACISDVGPPVSMFFNVNGSSGFRGYIDDFRIYEGVDIGLELTQNISTTTKLLNSVSNSYPIQMYTFGTYPSFFVCINADTDTLTLTDGSTGTATTDNTLRFSGTNSYKFANGGTKSASIPLPSSFTLSCVLRFTSGIASSVPFALVNSVDSTKSIELLMTSGGVFSLASGSPPASITLTPVTTCAPPINTWYYIAITVSSSGGVILYLNGYANGATSGATIASSICNNNVKLILGALNTSGISNNPFNGNIDDLRIYNGVLSQLQIQNIYTDMSQIIPYYNISLDSNFSLPIGSSGVGVYTYDSTTKISGENSLKITGATACITIPPKDFSGFTVSCWLRPTSVVTNTSLRIPVLFMNNSSAYNVSICQTGVSNKAQLVARLYDPNISSPNDQTLSVGFEVVADTWYYVTLVLDYITVMLFVNGKKIGDIIRSSLVSENSVFKNYAKLFIGDSSGSAFLGNIDELKVYQASMNKYQIESLYESYITGNTYYNLKNISYSSNTIYQLYTNLSNKVYLSTNSGITFTDITSTFNFNPFTLTVFSHFISSTGQYMILCTTKEFYYSDNNGTTWSKLKSLVSSSDVFKNVTFSGDGSYLTILYTSGIDIKNTAVSINTISIGRQAGQINQNANSIAIGYQAGQSYQPANTIIMNANNTPLNAYASNGCFIAPIASYTNSTSTRINLLGYGSDNQIVQIGPFTPSVSNTILGGINILGNVMTQTSKSQETLLFLTKSGTVSNISSVTAALSLGVEDNNSGQSTSGRLDIKLSGTAGAGNNWGSNADVTVATFAATQEIGETRRYLQIPSKGNIFMAAEGSSSIYFMGGNYTPGNSKSAVNCFGRFFGVVDGTNSSRIIQDFNDRVEWRRTDITGSVVADTKMTLSTTGLKIEGTCTATSFPTGSDQRIKQNIEDADPAKCMATISAIRMRRYEINSEITQNTIQDRHQIGVIAQELETVLPKAIHVQERFGIPDFKMVDKDQIYMTLVGAVQQLIKDNATQQQQIKDLLATTATLQAQIATLSPSSQMSSTGPTGSTGSSGL